jgi:hypothetical protein
VRQPKIPAPAGILYQSFVHGYLEEEKVERLWSLYSFERPEGDEVVADAYDFHSCDGGFCSR